MWGFEDHSLIEGWEKGFSEIPEEKALRSEFMELVVRDSYSVQILQPIKTIKRKTECVKK
jgi:hypothetical protein